MTPPTKTKQYAFTLMLCLLLGGALLSVWNVPSSSAVEVEPYCTIEFLEPVWGAEALNAASICSLESSSDPSFLDPACLEAKTPTYSVGLFQINLLNRCPLGLGWTGDFDNPQCWIVDQAELDTCKEIYGWGDPDLNSAQAKKIFDALGWCAWGPAPLLGLCGDRVGDAPVEIPEGSIPKIGGLNLELDWPAIPIPGGESIRLNDILEGEGTTICISQFVRFFYALALWMSGLIAFSVLVYVGIIYQLSGNNPTLRSRAFNQARKIFIGMAILFFAVIILNTIDPGLNTLKLCGPNPPVPSVALVDVEIGGEIERGGEAIPLGLPIDPLDIVLFANGVMGSLAVSTSDPVTLSWATSEATRCEATSSPSHPSWNGEKSLNGSEPLGTLASGTHRFSLVCFRSTIDTLVATVFVIVGGEGAGPTPTADIKLVNPEGSFDGPLNFQSSNLNIDNCFDSNWVWTSTDADFCVFTGPKLPTGKEAPSGSTEVILQPFSGTFDYSITCTNESSGESGSDRVTIQMLEGGGPCS